MNSRHLKDLLYEPVARVGKALASPKRLEMLAQGEKSVEALADAVAVDIKLDSAHLKALKEARPVQSRREGKPMSDEAEALMKKRGFRARQSIDGVSEWQAAVLPVARPYQCPPTRGGRRCLAEQDQRTGEWPATHHRGYSASARLVLRHGGPVLAEPAVRVRHPSRGPGTPSQALAQDSRFSASGRMMLRAFKDFPE